MLKIAKWTGLTATALLALSGAAMIVVDRYNLAPDTPLAIPYFVTTCFLFSMFLTSLISIAAIKWNRLPN